MAAIAIVGMACRYPDARTPHELWENVLAQRRAFRQIPPERLRLEDYYSAEPSTADCTYATQAAVIEGYEFDRVRFRVSGSQYRAADLSHWLALDVAAGALADAGFHEGADLPHETTGVFLGNTLTGEFSRANLMRYRWPYVRRVVDAALAKEGWSAAERGRFLESLEVDYKKPFPGVDEESLAGALSNTIAGRICNHFGLKGGGYTVDGACASSLLALTHACTALDNGDVDVALAGGVDLSLDPFELVGFAKAGALADGEMRVYDTRSAGFWPGEGCGLVLLMRLREAQAEQRRIYSVIRGWGISSDGGGGMTRPETDGQLLAIRRAYARAGFGIATVRYFEGHGTGTSVGDSTELRVLSRALSETKPAEFRACVGSIKANIGHTKAAAGVAGLLKASLALHNEIVPPATGCEKPHHELAAGGSRLQVLSQGELWPDDAPRRAAVSAMGFGGINTHVVLEEWRGPRRRVLNSADLGHLPRSQDAELFLLDAPDAEERRHQAERLLAFSARLSRAELADLAAELQRRLTSGRVRAAIVASTPAELTERLQVLATKCKTSPHVCLDRHGGVFVGTLDTPPRIGFLFPGQGSPAHLNGGIWRSRFAWVRRLYASANGTDGDDCTATEVAQPAIMTACLTGLRTLEHFGIRASVAVGHSLGELAALHWAGAIDEEQLQRIAAARGRAMAERGSTNGAMASIAAGQGDVESFLEGEKVVIAGINSSRQTVISGPADAVAGVVTRVRARGLRAVLLPVSHAFHSPLIAEAESAFAEHLAGESFRPLSKQVISTVSGALLRPLDDVFGILRSQLTSPVRFLDAIKTAPQVDLWIEVGPGQVLTGLMADISGTPAFALDAGGPTLVNLLHTLGAAFALGAAVNHAELFAFRLTRPFTLDWRPRFFVNPCELAPLPDTSDRLAATTSTDRSTEDRARPAATGKMRTVTSMTADAPAAEATSHPDTLVLVRQLMAERAELPAAVVRPEHRLLSDLHLNSIAVSQLVALAAKRLGLPPPTAPTQFADATVADVATALAEWSRTRAVASAKEDGAPAGMDSWIRAFTMEHVECPLPRRRLVPGEGQWRVIAPTNHPLASPLAEALARAGCASGALVCLPPEPDERHISLLLEGARAVSQARLSSSARSVHTPRSPSAFPLTTHHSPLTHFLLVQQDGGGGAFARTLHQEMSGITTCVVDVPFAHPRAPEWVVAEIQASQGYHEAHYDWNGRRREPRLCLLAASQESLEVSLSPDDVMLVTGGGKGIAAECALALGRETAVRLVLVGRSQPEKDSELAANLERLTAAGIRFRYVAADITDAETARLAVKEGEKEFGSITAVLHGAGTNVPQLLTSLNEEQFQRTLAPKIRGAQNILAALDPDRLRLFVAFGSLIARTGMRGEADYAVANEWLARLVEQFQVSHPACRCLAIEWSVWSGVGMGERLGRVETLRQQGITPIPPDRGIAIVRNLLSRRTPRTAVVVTGRFGEATTLRIDRPELPFRRFLEKPRIHYPGVELIADAELSVRTDPYLDDHIFQGERLLPAVMGLEAMAQAAMALAGSSDLPIFENVMLRRPIVIPRKGTATLRVAALVPETGIVDVALRCEETDFQVNHFEARCRFVTCEPDGRWAREPASDAAFTANRSAIPSHGAASDEEQPVDLDPEHDLYSGLLFHTGRFRRLRGYRRLRALECLADVAVDGTSDWFGRYLPSQLVLGDPGARDAVIHCIQACIPHATILPVGIERLVLRGGNSRGPWLVRARQRLRDGEIFVYDVVVAGSDGQVAELWQGLRLKRVAQAPPPIAWSEALLGPYLERRLCELIPGAMTSVTLDRDAGGGRRAQSDRAMQRMLCAAGTIARRPDGKPEVIVGTPTAVSASHNSDLTLAVAGEPPTSCDVEAVVDRSADVWQELLGSDAYALAGVIARTARESESVSATRVWTAKECAKKAGMPINLPLLLDSTAGDNWVVLTAGSSRIATYAADVRGMPARLVFAVLANPEREMRHAGL
jgi:enediyne polyketide synthase